MKRSLGILAFFLSAVLLVVAARQTSHAADNEEAAQIAAVFERATGTSDMARIDGHDGDSAVIASTSAGLVDVPNQSSGKVTVRGGGAIIGIGVPDPTDQPAAVSKNGTVVYADKSKPVDVAIQPILSGVRALVAIKDAGAPHEYRFPMDLPKGSRLVDAATLFGSDMDTGEVFVVDSHGKVTSEGYAKLPLARS